MPRPGLKPWGAIRSHLLRITAGLLVTAEDGLEDTSPQLPRGPWRAGGAGLSFCFCGNQRNRIGLSLFGHRLPPARPAALLAGEIVQCPAAANTLPISAPYPAV